VIAGPVVAGSDGVAGVAPKEESPEDGKALSSFGRKWGLPIMATIIVAIAPMMAIFVSFSIFPPAP